MLIPILEKKKHMLMIKNKIILITLATLATSRRHLETLNLKKTDFNLSKHIRIKLLELTDGSIGWISDWNKILRKIGEA